VPEVNEPYDPRSFFEDHVFDAPGLLGWLTRRRKATVMALLNVRLNRHAHAKVLDIGCGYGDMLADASATLRIGVDANLDAVRYAIRRAPGSRFALASVTHLPFSGDTFDGVICSEVLEHLDRPGLLAREIVRVTKPGGSYCITVPNESITTLGRFLLGKHPAKSPAHKQRFTPPTVAALFPAFPVAQQLTPFSYLPFALSTNVVMLFTKA
jgi:ubiquinone/menaquinone biosynthesis C-methylase UbiE